MGKKILLVLIIVSALGIGYFVRLQSAQKVEARYSVVGCGEGVIMVDGITGESWVLETEKVILGPSGILNCDNDFNGPKGQRYIWVHTAFRPIYSNALSENPVSAQQLDKESLELWKWKLNQSVALNS